MRIATWNVNSIRTRVSRVVDWLDRENIDVLAMQETKCKPSQFPVSEFDRAGYSLEIHGLNQWNGVAFASRHDMTEVTTEFAGMPGFGKPIANAETPQGIGANGEPAEARALGVTVGDVRLWSLYVPNGRGLDDPHMQYKLDWLAALRADTERWLQQNPNLPLALMGDWNVAPTDADMGDPSFVPGLSTHISEPERAAFAAFSPLMSDLVRPYVPEGYTYWDYKQLRFPRNEGMRIDFILGSPALRDATVGASIHRDERKGDSPSDHVPVVIDIDPSLSAETFDDEFDRPMVF
jgi:exodeoxyribonuclease-3